MRTVREPEKNSSLGIQKLFDDNKEKWSLQLLAGSLPTEKTVSVPEVHRPGLALTGFIKIFSFERVQVLGEIEYAYMDSLSPEGRRKAAQKVFSFPVPCIFQSKSFIPHKEIIEEADRTNVPVFNTPLSTMEIYDRLHAYLHYYFAPRIALHASFVDVYGVGMLYTGNPGIGKSECCLDLVERGHQLVADDIVHIRRSGNELIGRGNDLIGHHMEIRGLGIINVENLFGIRAIRSEKKVDVLVELVKWTTDMDYERIGLDENKVDILGIMVPKVGIPVSPGKNITVISEVVAMNILLQQGGVHSAKLFNKRLIETMQKTMKRQDSLNTGQESDHAQA